MLLNIHSFLGPLPIGIPSHWLFASRSQFSLPMEVCWARHPPVIADHHDTPAVTGDLHPLLDTSPKNRRTLQRTWSILREWQVRASSVTAASRWSALAGCDTSGAAQACCERPPLSAEPSSKTPHWLLCPGLWSRHQQSVPRVRRSTFGSRAFSFVGPTAWNSLTDILCNAAVGPDRFRRFTKCYRIRASAMRSINKHLVTYLSVSS